MEQFRTSPSYMLPSRSKHVSDSGKANRKIGAAYDNIHKSSATHDTQHTFIGTTTKANTSGNTNTHIATARKTTKNFFHHPKLEKQNRRSSKVPQSSSSPYYMANQTLLDQRTHQPIKIRRPDTFTDSLELPPSFCVTKIAPHSL